MAIYDTINEIDGVESAQVNTLFRTGAASGLANISAIYNEVSNTGLLTVEGIGGIT